jgi:hypothetical protein
VQNDTPLPTMRVDIKADVNPNADDYNVIADSKRGDPSHVLVVDAHLDAIFGAGMLDNASGSAAILRDAQNGFTPEEPADATRPNKTSTVAPDIRVRCHHVKALRRNLRALRVPRIALHHAAARLRDQVEGTTKRHRCDAFPSILPVDEETRDAIVRRLLRAGRVVFLPVVNTRELVRRTVLAHQATALSPSKTRAA